jgi:hypothetical protein
MEILDAALDGVVEEALELPASEVAGPYDEREVVEVEARARLPLSSVSSSICGSIAIAGSPISRRPFPVQRRFRHFSPPNNLDGPRGH